MRRLVTELWRALTCYWVCFQARSQVLKFGREKCSCRAAKILSTAAPACRPWLRACVLLPYFNVLPDIIAVRDCSVLALSAVLCYGHVTWSADNSCSLQWHIVQQWERRVRVEIMCMLCQQTSSKCWFANVNIMSYFDVTNSVFPLTITTICHYSILEFRRGACNPAVARASPDVRTPLPPRQLFTKWDVTPNNSSSW